jgi:hypothetical protein
VRKRTLSSGRVRAGAACATVLALASVALIDTDLAASPPSQVAPNPPSASVPALLPASPLLQPEASPLGGYLVTCNIAALSPNCEHLLIITGPLPANLSPSNPAALVTMLVNVPSAYPYLANWVPYNANEPATTTAPPASDPTYDAVAYSGAGGTTGTQIAIYANDAAPWSVPSGDTADVSAALNSSGNTMRCGELIGQFSGRYLNDPVPFYSYDSVTVSPSSTDLNGYNLYFQASLNTGGQGVCNIKTTGGSEILTGAISGVNLPKNRQNRIDARFIQSGSAYPYVGGGNGWFPYAYYQSTFGGGYAAWGEVSFGASSVVYGWQADLPYTFRIGCFTGLDSSCQIP